LNALLKQDRMIVSDVPGTTRDAIDTTLPWGRTEIVLIDTAGIRRRGRVAGGPAAEKYSTLRSFRAISRADVAVLLIDAVDGLTAQDMHIAGFVVDEGRGLVVAVNKWDAVEEKTGSTFDQYVEWIRHEAPFLDFAPVVSISAKTGQRVERVLELAVDVWAERRRRIPTGELNRVIGDATARQDPPMVKGRRPKLFYATQVGVAPPTFVFFARDAASIHFSYRRYLENRLREEFGFLGTPVRLVFRERATVREPRRGGRSGGGRASGRPTKRESRPTVAPKKGRASSKRAAR
jgi:GTP-binding protein